MNLKQKVGHYEILEEIGRGGMGIVYRARDLNLDREVALKCPLPELAKDPSSRQRFVKEGRAASRLSHPGIVPIFEVFEAEGRPWFAMDLVEGGSLSGILRAGGALPVDQILRHGECLAEALALAHKRRVLHRDINPRNVLITEDGRAQLTDFGLARLFVPPDEVSSASTRSSDSREKGRIVGTPGYMSPEQALGRELDPRSDIFCLGLVIYESCTGRPAFASSDGGDVLDAILHREPVPISRLNYEVPEELERIVRKCLAKDRDHRYQNAGDLLVDLRALRRQRESGSRERVDPPGPHGRPGLGWAAAGAGTLIAAMALLALWIGPSWQPRPPEARRPAVAVLPFEDRTGHPQGDLHGTMLSDLLSAGLSEAPGLRPLGRDRLRELLGSAPAGEPLRDRMERVASATPVDWFVKGSLFREGETYIAAVEVLGAGTLESHGSFRVEAAQRAVLATLASSRIRDLLEPGPGAGSGSIPVEAISSLSEEARMSEHLGRIALRERRFLEAIDRFQAALEHDPRFVSAAVHLAGALKEAGYGSRARAAADRAVRLVEGAGARATSRLALEARAIHARVHDDRQGEIEARRALSRAAPDAPDVLLDLVGSLIRGAAADEALVVAERALALDRGYPRAHLERARALIGLGRLGEAEEALARARRLYEDLGMAEGLAKVAMARGHLEFKDGDYEASAQAYGAAAGSFRDAGLEVRAAQADKARGDLALKQGRLAEARGHYSSATQTARAAGNRRLIVSTQGSLGGQLFLRGQYDQAEEALREAVREARELGNVPLLMTPLINLASLLNYTNRLGEGRALAAEAVQLAQARSDRPKETTALFLLADADYQLGRIGDAIRSYRDLVRLERSPDGSRENLARALMSLASILTATGATGEARDAADEAVEIGRRLGNTADLGYGLAIRGLVLGHLALWEEAAADLREAAEIARAGSEGLDHLMGTVTLARGQVASMRGQWTVAQDRFDEARRAGEATGSIGMAVPALAGSSDVARRQGRTKSAVSLAREALEHPRALADEKVLARAYLSRALSMSGAPREAEGHARRALDEAESMGLQLAAAVAARAAVELSPPDREALQDRGREAISGYLSAAPAGRREEMRRRADIRDLVATLETRTAAGAPGDEGPADRAIPLKEEP